MELISSSRWIGNASIDDAFPSKTRFFRFFAFSMSRCFRWSSGLSQFSRRKRFWICLRWFGKQLVWSNEMIKQLDVPPQTFPVLLYAGMYWQKNWITTWIHRHEWLRKVEDQCFIMHILSIFRAGRTCNLIHQQLGQQGQDIGRPASNLVVKVTQSPAISLGHWGFVLKKMRSPTRAGGFVWKYSPLSECCNVNLFRHTATTVDTVIPSSSTLVDRPPSLLPFPIVD